MSIKARAGGLTNCDRLGKRVGQFRPHTRLNRHAKNVDHVTLPEIKDFNALRDA